MFFAKNKSHFLIKSIAFFISTFSMIACANNTNSEYHLPSTSVPAATPETTFLKSFSKVFSNIAKEAKPALIMIMAEKKVVYNQPSFDDFFFPFFPPEFGGPNGPRNPHGRKKEGKETAGGSGFIVDLKNGYAITNNHVIEGADNITVTTFDNHKYKAKLVGTAKNVDVAVLKILDFKDGPQLKALNLADSDDVEVGDWSIALGAPFELPQTLTMGVVSAVKRSGDVLGINGPNNFIQTDASINPGNSGGPLLNIYGQVIGMNTAIFSRTGTSVGIGFAIPSNTIRFVADSIISTGKLTQSYLGVEMYDVSKFSPSVLKDMKIPSNVDGGFIMRVLPNSPAAKAGLQPYDIIQSINGNNAKSMSEIQAQIMFAKPGSTIKVGILRDGKKLTLNAIVSELPGKISAKNDDIESQSASGTDETSITNNYGFKLSDKKHAGGGVIISSVYNGSLAEAVGLKVGDVMLQVNRTNVNSKEDVEQILKKAEKAGTSMLLLLVERDGNKTAIMLQVGE